MTTHRLVLIRHAKTAQAPPRPEDGDHGRELTDRGRADAQAAGRWLVEEGLLPDLVLCSTSTRTRQTWEAMVAGAEALAGVQIEHDRRIYNASSEPLRQVLVEAPGDAVTVAMLGHAPGIPDLVADLADLDLADGAAAAALERGFPTMACAVLETDQAWDGIPAQSARLRRVHTPRGDH